MIIPSRTIQLKKGQTVTLRSPRPSEADLMLEHLRISHSESYKNLNQTSEYWSQFSLAEEEKILKDFESSDGKFMVVAFCDGKVIGGLGFVGGFRPFLQHNARLGMSIQKAFCGLGLGSEMMKYSLEMGKKNGFHRVELTVRTYNEAGIALYEKSGFERVGLLKDAAFIDGEFVDEVLYQLILE